MSLTPGYNYYYMTESDYTTLSALAANNQSLALFLQDFEHVGHYWAYTGASPSTMFAFFDELGYTLDWGEYIRSTQSFGSF